MIPNRIREVREEHGLTLEALAELSGLSTSQISRIEKGERGWTVESISSIAKALNVSVVELIDKSRVWQDVPVFGTVGEQGIVTLKALNGMATSPSSRLVQVPAALGDVLAFAVQGTSLYPRYEDGDLLVCHEAANENNDCLDVECVVQIKDGPMVIRTVHRGSQPDTFLLATHNQPPIEKQIYSCRPIIYIGRKALSNPPKPTLKPRGKSN